jgi:glucose-1-phosphate adenylyltransferase
MSHSKAESLNFVASIILAGGQGTRLYPLTRTRCKPSVCFGGRYRLIDIPISNSLNARIGRIFVISQHFASALQQHIFETYKLDQFREAQIRMLCPEEDGDKRLWFKGTADAIRQNREVFELAPVDYFLVLSGDQLYNIDFVELLNYAKAQDVDLVIAALPVEESEARRMGLLQIDKKQRIISFVEKPSDSEVIKRYQLPKNCLEGHALTHSDAPHFLASMGIYVFKKQALLDLIARTGDDFGKDLIPWCVQEGKASAYVYKGYWEDIGTIRSYYNANMALLSQKRCLNMYDEYNPIFTHPRDFPSPLVRESWIRRSIIGQGALIGAKEVTESIVGVNLEVGEGTVIRGSILLGALGHASHAKVHRVVGKNCHIENTILDEGALVGDHVVLTNREGVLHYDGDGIYIRDGITVVSAGTKLPDGFVL